MNWQIDKTITYLNHGAFGACPQEILDEFTGWQRNLESSPSRFILRRLDENLRESRRVLSVFTGAEAEGMALVSNATHGVNTVLKSLNFKKGDEVIITNHIYPACLNALRYLEAQHDLVIRVVDIPFEGVTAGIIEQRVLEAVSAATRLVMLDHVTSPTALVFPVKTIVDELNHRGIESLIDGAHAPGSLPLNIGDINPTYYTGNCHKWMCLPKSCGFLWVRADARKKTVPLAISHAWGDKATFAEKFHWQGTADWSAALCIPFAVNLIGTQANDGWKGWMEQNHQLVIRGRDALCRALQIEPPCDNTLLASMATVPVAGKPQPLSLGYNKVDQLQEMLFRDHAIEVPVFQWPDANHRVLRISAQQYNNPEQYDRLAQIIGALQNKQ